MAIDNLVNTFTLSINPEGIIYDSTAPSRFAYDHGLVLSLEHIRTYQLHVMDYLMSKPLLHPLREDLINILSHKSDNIITSLPEPHQDVEILLQRTLQGNAHFTLSDYSEEQQQLAQLLLSRENYLHAISVIAHELPSPLTGILGGAAIIEVELRGHQPPLNDEVAKAIDKTLKNIRRSAKRIDEMRKRYINFAREELGNLEPQYTVVPLQRIITNVLEDLVDEENHHQISQEGQMRNIFLVSDIQFLTIIFNNLFSNALKYGGPAAIITYGVRELPTHYELFVKNTGSIVKDPEKIFLPLEREDTEKPGTGLGLYNAKRHVEALGGRIWAESDHSEITTTFTFTLPDTSQGSKYI